MRQVIKEASLAQQRAAGAVGGSNKLRSLVEQMIDEKIAQGAGMKIKVRVPKKKKRSSRSVPAGGFIGKHPMDYSGGCDECCHCGGLLAGGPVGGIARKPLKEGYEYVEECRKVQKKINRRQKAKTVAHLLPYNAAQKALAGIKFNNKTKRQMEITDLAQSAFSPDMSVAANSKRMREWFVQYRLPELIQEQWIVSIPEKISSML